MNILTDPLPTAVEIDGMEFEISTDFRDALRVILAFEDREMAAVEQQAVMLHNLYPVTPGNIGEALRLGVKFLDGGEDRAEDDSGSGLRLYSFNQDANYIFAAFKQMHGIDLQEVEYLHWWVFLALFMDLGPDTTFVSLINLRKRIKSGEKLTDAEKKMYREMRSMIDLKDDDERLTPDEQAEYDLFMREVLEGEARRERERQEAKLRSWNHGRTTQETRDQERDQGMG